MSEEESFEARLLAAMADMENPMKTATGTTGRRTYDYETLNDVLDIVQPALRAHGLDVKQGSTLTEHGGWALKTSVLADGSGGGGVVEQLMDMRPLYFPDDDPKAAGSWETYMRRYALKSAFGLCGEDDDGEAACGDEDAAAGAFLALARKACETYKEEGNPVGNLLEWARENIADKPQVEYTADEAEKFAVHCVAEANRAAELNGHGRPLE